MGILLNGSKKLGIILGFHMIPHDLDLTISPQLQKFAVACPQSERNHFGGMRAQLLHQKCQTTHPNLPVLDLVLNEK